MNYSSGDPGCKGNAGIPALDLFVTALASGMRPSRLTPAKSGIWGRAASSRACARYLGPTDLSRCLLSEPHAGAWRLIVHRSYHGLSDV